MILDFKDWMPLMRAYLTRNSSDRTYRLRSGASIHANDPADSVTVAVVFGHREYGPAPATGSVIDIGANIGAYTLYAAHASPSVSVVAFEPMPRTYQTLVENVARNRLEDRVVCHQIAVAGTEGKQKLYNLGASALSTMYPKAEGAGFIEVPSITLDAVLKMLGGKPCAMLKLDCEGAEFDVLYGASPDTLLAIQRIRMEYHGRVGCQKATFEDLSDYLSGRGFSITRHRVDSPRGGIAWFERAS